MVTSMQGGKVSKLRFEAELDCEVSTETLCDDCHRYISRVQWWQCQGCKDFDLCYLCKMKNPPLSEVHLQNCPKTQSRSQGMAFVSYMEDLASGVREELYRKHLDRILNKKLEDNRDVLILLKEAKKMKDNQAWKQQASLKLLEYLQGALSNQIRILSIDGGGTRGIMVLKILESLELSKSAWDAFISKIDYFAGTSAGALVAFGLCTNIPLQSLIDIFKRKLFKKKSYTKYPMRSSQYDPELIHNEIKAVLVKAFKTKDDSVPDEEIPDRFTLKFLHEHWFGARNGGLVVNAYDCTSGTVRIFNSRYPPHHQFKVFDILTSSMAAPTFFPMNKMTIDGCEHLLVDGGLFANNPELSGLWAAYLDSKMLASYRILSIGTGLGRSKFLNIRGSRDEGLPGWICNKRIFDVMLESNMSFSSTLARQLASFLKIQRFRFNCRFPVNLSLDDESFHETFDRYKETIIKSPEFTALKKYAELYIINSRGAEILSSL